MGTLLRLWTPDRSAWPRDGLLSRRVRGTVGWSGAVVTPAPDRPVRSWRQRPIVLAKVMLFCYAIYVVRLACAWSGNVSLYGEARSPTASGQEVMIKPPGRREVAPSPSANQESDISPQTRHPSTPNHRHPPHPAALLLPSIMKLAGALISKPPASFMIDATGVGAGGRGRARGERCGGGGERCGGAQGAKGRGPGHGRAGRERAGRAAREGGRAGRGRGLGVGGG